MFFIDVLQFFIVIIIFDDLTDTYYKIKNKIFETLFLQKINLTILENIRG